MIPFTSKKTCFAVRRRHHRKPKTNDPTNTAAPSDKPHAIADEFELFLLSAAVKAAY